MKARSLVGLALIGLGILALVYGGFSYTDETHDVELGPVELQVTEKERVNIPAWGGVAAIIVGAAILLMQRSKS